MSDPIYVQYTVQKGDALWDLWRKSDMTREEWVNSNEGRNPGKILHVGEKIVVKDSITTCAVFRVEAFKAVGYASYSSLAVIAACEKQYHRFKPLKVYTEALQVKALKQSYGHRFSMMF